MAEELSLPGADGPSCPCGVPVEQPWRTRNKLWSPASFIGGLLWLGLGIGSVIGGWDRFGLILLGVLALLVLGSLVLQGIRGHRRSCLLRRGLWFGIAAPGLPLRVGWWINF